MQSPHWGYMDVPQLIRLQSSRIVTPRFLPTCYSTSPKSWDMGGISLTPSCCASLRITWGYILRLRCSHNHAEFPICLYIRPSCRCSFLKYSSVLGNKRLQRSRIKFQRVCYSTALQSERLGRSCYPKLLRCAPHHLGLHSSTALQSQSRVSRQILRNYWIKILKYYLIKILPSRAAGLKPLLRFAFSDSVSGGKPT